MEEKNYTQGYTAEGRIWIEVLRRSVVCIEQFAGAAAYLGECQVNHLAMLPEWIRQNNPRLTRWVPFLVEIPQQDVVGGSSLGCGELFCVLPRDKDTSLIVRRLTWNGAVPVPGEVLYHDKDGLPILLFSNSDQPDVEVVLERDNGTRVTWYSQCAQRAIVLPTDERGVRTIMDFSNHGMVQVGM